MNKYTPQEELLALDLLSGLARQVPASTATKAAPQAREVLAIALEELNSRRQKDQELLQTLEKVKLHKG